jgi:hypothetical protein
MDERRFDALTKALVAAKPSRREALRRLAGGALATVFGSLALKGASAQDVGTAARTCGQGCNNDDECNAGLRCTTTGSEKCLAIPNSGDNCNSNEGCTSKFETCNNNGKCVNTVADCDECRENDDCEGTDVCKDGSCRKRECEVNNDCGKNKKCKNGKCVKKN